MYILIVEDNTQMARLYGQILKNEGFAVEVAPSLEEARSAMQISRPDVLLLNQVLPDGSGSNFCQLLKGNPDTSSIFVILISGMLTAESDQISGLDVGADDYLFKPISTELLLARVRAAVRVKRIQEDLWAVNELLHSSEERFRSTFEQTGVGMAHIALDGRFLRVNQRFCQIVGYGPEELTERTCQSLTYAGDRERNLDLSAQLLSGLLPAYEMEQRFVRPDGSLVWTQVNVSLLSFPDGRPRYLISVIHDISDRKEAEEKWRRSAETFRALAENTPDLVVRYDKRLRFLYANPQTLERMNLPAEKLIGQSNQELPLPQELRDLWDAALLEVFANKQKIKIEFDLQVQGETRYFEALMAPEFNAQAEVETALSVTRDVTKRVAAEMENLRLAAVVEQAIEGVLITSVDSEVLCFNPYVEKVSGYSCKELKGKTPRIFRSGVHPPEYDREVYEKTRSGFPWRGTFINRRKNGERYYEATSVFPFASLRRGVTQQIETERQREAMIAIAAALRQADTKEEVLLYNRTNIPPSVAAVPLLVQRQIIGVLWTGRSLPIGESDLQILSAIGDIAASAIYRADLYAQSQEYAAQLERRVAERTRQLEQANTELQVLDEMKSKFVSDISHELRTPLASLELYTELLIKGKAEKHEGYRQAIRQTVERLAELLEDILSLSRLETKTVNPPVLHQIELNSIAEQVVDLFSPRAETAGLSLRFVPDPTLPPLLGDSNQLSRAIANLLTNAINYTRSGGLVVETGRTPNPGHIFLTVTDTGIGIPEKDLPHVLERFYRGQHGEVGVPGTGLGLAIVKEIVDMHGGRIEIESAPGAGTTVKLSLPPVGGSLH